MVLDEIDIGRRVASARELAGITQRNLAARIGVSVNTLSRIEVGVTENPNARIISDIAQALGCTTDYLLGLSDVLTVKKDLL
jgi:transcriptional regulator with XRE-family HTH domain